MQLDDFGREPDCVGLVCTRGTGLLPSLKQQRVSCIALQHRAQFPTDAAPNGGSVGAGVLEFRPEVSQGSKLVQVTTIVGTVIRIVLEAARIVGRKARHDCHARWPLGQAFILPERTQRIVSKRPKRAIRVLDTYRKSCPWRDRNRRCSASDQLNSSQFI
jgi:hypothetical protein